MTEVFRIYCKEDVTDVNQNFFKIKDAGYGETYTRWKKGEFYRAKFGSEHEQKLGQWVFIEQSYNGVARSMSEKEFNQYFETIEDHRNTIIEEILYEKENVIHKPFWRSWYR